MGYAQFGYIVIYVDFVLFDIFDRYMIYVYFVLDVICVICVYLELGVVFVLYNMRFYIDRVFVAVSGRNNSVFFCAPVAAYHVIYGDYI